MILARALSLLGQGREVPADFVPLLQEVQRLVHSQGATAKDSLAVAFAVQQELGGKIAYGRLPDGQVHNWNLLPGGVEVDLLSGQLGGDGIYPTVPMEAVRPMRQLLGPGVREFWEEMVVSKDPREKPPGSGWRSNVPKVQAGILGRAIALLGISVTDLEYLQRPGAAYTVLSAYRPDPRAVKFDPKVPEQWERQRDREKEFQTSPRPERIRWRDREIEERTEKENRSRAENRRRHGELTSELERRGYSWTPVYGFYAERERSILVEGVEWRDAVELGNWFDQESIIFKPSGGPVGMYRLRDSEVIVSLAFDVKGHIPEEEIGKFPSRFRKFGPALGLNFEELGIKLTYSKYPLSWRDVVLQSPDAIVTFLLGYPGMERELRRRIPDLEQMLPTLPSREAEL